MSKIRRETWSGQSSTADRHLIFKTPTATLTTASLSPGETGFALSTSTSELIVQVRYPDGTLMCALVCLNAA